MYTIIRLLDKSKYVILFVFLIYYTVNLIGVYIVHIVESDKIINNSFIDDALSNLLTTTCLGISIIILSHYSNEIKDNNFGLLIAYGKKKSFFLLDVWRIWLISTIILFLIGIVVTFTFIEVLNIKSDISYSPLDILCSFINGTLFFTLFSLILCFLIEKYFISFILILILRIVDKYIYVKTYIDTSNDISSYLPFNGANTIRSLGDHEVWAISILYLIILALSFTFIINRFYNNPRLRFEKSGI